MPVPAPSAVVPVPAGRIQGALDMVRPDRIGGWALDRTDRAASLEVDVFREGRRIATLRADRERLDLAKASDGSGRHGFALVLDPPLEPGFEFTVTAVARAADGTRSTLRRTGAATTPERRLLERLFDEVTRPREALAEAPGVADAVRSLEVTQARIEAALARLEAPKPAAAAELRWIVFAALATGIVSLALGLWSMFAS